MNLREVIEKNQKMFEKSLLVTMGGQWAECSLYEETVMEMRSLFKQDQVGVLDAIIKRVNQEASEYVNDEQAGRTALAYELHNELSKAREDITSLQ